MAGQSKGVRARRSSEAEACNHPPLWPANGPVMCRTVCRHPFSPPCPGADRLPLWAGGRGPFLTWPFLPAAPLSGRHCSPFAGHTKMNEVNQRDGKRVGMGANQPHRLYADSRMGVSQSGRAPPVPPLAVSQDTELCLTSLHKGLLGTFRPGAVTVTLPSTSTLGWKTPGMWSATGSRKEAGA